MTRRGVIGATFRESLLTLTSCSGTSWRSRLASTGGTGEFSGPDDFRMRSDGVGSGSVRSRRAA